LGKSSGGISIRQIRLACGLVLIAYLVSHFGNHALGKTSRWSPGHRPSIPHAASGNSLYRCRRVLCRLADGTTGFGIWALYEGGGNPLGGKPLERLSSVLGLKQFRHYITLWAGVGG